MSNTTKHTPGPWSYTSRGDIIGNGCSLALVKSSAAIVSEEQDKANARLIAAAPDLLAELQEMAEVLNSGIICRIEPDSAKAAKIRAAIAKAKGVQS